jgi:hypothetical protein
MADQEVLVMEGNLLPPGKAILDSEGFKYKKTILSWGQIQSVSQSRRSIQPRWSGLILVALGFLFLTTVPGLRAHIMVPSICALVIFGVKIVKTFEVFGVDGRSSAVRGDRAATQRVLDRWRASPKIDTSNPPAPLVKSRFW